MNQWLVIGSSPNAPQAMRRARLHCSTVITTNRGILIEPTPDYYFLSDNTACSLFHAHAQLAQTHGTQLVTLQRSQQALRLRGVSHFDQFIREGHPYEPFQMSGLWCVEYAIRSGADAIALVGCEGYGGSQDYFGDASQFEKNGDLTKRVIEPLTNRLVAKYPEIEFTCYGRPHYEVEAANWHLL